MLHPLPLPLSSCLGCIPPLIGLPSLRFYAVGSSLFLLSVCFCLCSLFYRDDVLCWLLLARPFLYAFHAHLRFPVDLVWFRLSCDHGWIRSGSVNVRKQQQQPRYQDVDPIRLSLGNPFMFLPKLTINITNVSTCFPRRLWMLGRLRCVHDVIFILNLAFSLRENLEEVLYSIMTRKKS